MPTVSEQHEAHTCAGRGPAALLQVRGPGFPGQVPRVRITCQNRAFGTLGTILLQLVI